MCACIIFSTPSFPSYFFEVEHFPLRPQLGCVLIEWLPTLIFCRNQVFFPSMTYFCTSSDPMTRMKQASVLLATALAQSVLPVPGGPYSSTPFGGSTTNKKVFRRVHQTRNDITVPVPFLWD